MLLKDVIGSLKDTDKIIVFYYIRPITSLSYGTSMILFKGRVEDYKNRANTPSPHFKVTNKYYNEALGYWVLRLQWIKEK